MKVKAPKSIQAAGHKKIRQQLEAHKQKEAELENREKHINKERNFINKAKKDLDERKRSLHHKTLQHLKNIENFKNQVSKSYATNSKRQMDLMKHSTSKNPRSSPEEVHKALKRNQLPGSHSRGCPCLSGQGLAEAEICPCALKNSSDFEQSSNRSQDDAEAADGE